jgi:hypothetical protein
MKTFNPKDFTPQNPGPKIRRLKIEEDGDPWKGKVRPKIRLQGGWLEQAGFKHGNYVRVKCVAVGVIELHSSESELMLNES